MFGSTPYERIASGYSLYILGPPRHASNYFEQCRKLAENLGLGMCRDFIQFGNGYFGPYWTPRPGEPPQNPPAIRRLTIGVVYPDARCSVHFAPGYTMPIETEGDWHHPNVALAKALLEANLNCTIN